MPSGVGIMLPLIWAFSFHVVATSGSCIEQARAIDLPDFSAQWLDMKPYMHLNAFGDTQGVLFELLSLLNTTVPLNIQLGRRYNINDFQEFKNVSLSPSDSKTGLIVLPVTKGKKDYPDPCVVSAYHAKGCAYIVKRNVKKPLLQLGNSFINGGQIMAITLILSIISGIFIWILDRKKNSDCFPASFITGTWQGFWWAFVTMTTVGYGDIYPKSVQARLYSIVWMLIGMVAFSLLTANITNSLTYEIESDLNLYGKIIAVLNESMERQAAVAYGAGFKEYPNISSMAAALHEGEVNAMLLETHIASGSHEINFETGNLEIAKTIDYGYYFGMHLHHVFPNVCSVIKECVEEVVDGEEFQSKALKVLSDQVVLDKLATTSDNLFEDPSFFYILVAIFTFMGIVGMLWEYCYFRKKMRRRTEAESATNASEMEGGTPVEDHQEVVENKVTRVKSIRVRPSRQAQWSPNF